MSPPDPARFVADADVLAADLLVGGPSREALDLARSHRWIHLIASEPLLSEAQTVIESLTDKELAADWRRCIDELATVIEPTHTGHPAITAAEAGQAATVLSLDPALRSPQAGVTIRESVTTSVKSPAAFVRLVDLESLFEVVEGGAYPGPDREPYT